MHQIAQFFLKIAPEPHSSAGRYTPCNIPQAGCISPPRILKIIPPCLKMNLGPCVQS